MVGAEVSVRRKGHTFHFSVIENGIIEYQIDGGQNFTARGIKDGKVIIGEQEIVVDDEIVTVNAIDLDVTDYSILLAEVNRAKEEASKGKDELKEYSLSGLTKKELLHRISKWQKKTKTYRKNKQKHKYVIHTITIGAEMYRMIEREVDGYGVVISPDYKISNDKRITQAGGVAEQRDEVVMWRYYFDDGEPSSVDPNHNKGHWEDVKMLSFNETICYEIIRRFGTFSEESRVSAEKAKSEKSAKKGLFGKKEKKVS